MRKWIIGALLIAAVTVRFVVASSPSDPQGIDPRFDGRWVGVETFRLNNADESWQGGPPQIQAVLVIAKSGTMVGFISGFAPGRYIISPKSKGNAIWFDSERRKAKLTLSADGNTIKEEGNAAIFVHYRGNVLTGLSCTFRRIGK